MRRADNGKQVLRQKSSIVRALSLVPLRGVVLLVVPGTAKVGLNKSSEQKKSNVKAAFKPTPTRGLFSAARVFEISAELSPIMRPIPQRSCCASWARRVFAWRHCHRRLRVSIEAVFCDSQNGSLCNEAIATLRARQLSCGRLVGLRQRQQTTSIFEEELVGNIFCQRKCLTISHGLAERP